jgi:hypothetical protein
MMTNTKRARKIAFLMAARLPADEPLGPDLYETAAQAVDELPGRSLSEQADAALEVLLDARADA